MPSLHEKRIRAEWGNYRTNLIIGKIQFGNIVAEEDWPDYIERMIIRLLNGQKNRAA